jgi:glucosamine kinase
VTAITTRDLFLGVDGGGTGCRARVIDGEGRVLGCGKAGPAALRFGVERVAAEVQIASLSALAEAGLDPAALGAVRAAIGLAGVGRKGALEHLNAQPHPFRSVVYAHDAAIACIGAHAGRDGGIVVVGTGSVGFGFVGGREIRVGGYGFPISDAGSGADLGLNAIRAALRAHDEGATGSPLIRDIMLRFHDDSFEAVAWMDQATATHYATFAPLVMRHADAGDAVARDIVRSAADQIGRLARRLIQSGVPGVALLGGLASPIQRWLADDIQCHLVAPEGDAVDGALLLARRSAG